jgi:hypothetical protein
MELSTLEQNARRAKEANSFFDYKPGSATTEYQEYCKAADEAAQKAKERLAKTGAPAERTEKVDYLLGLYRSKKLSWLNEMYSVRARVPSVMIAGPANFPVRAKQKQLAREESLNDQDPDYILEEIHGIGHNAKTIYSDDKNAVERIKAKIAALEVAPPDRWGYNKTEIRRLKERLLTLAPEEFAEQQANISINGAKTYDEIVVLWDKGRLHKSAYSPESPEWYYDLFLDFTDGKRHYKEFLQIQVDESGESMHRWNNDTRQSEFIPLTESLKYNLIIGRISGSGNKAVIYQHLKSLTPKAQAAKVNEESDDSEADDTVTINGESAKVVRNKEDMRLQLMFDGKPDEKTREALKSNGFRWAPSCMAWQRLLNENAEWALRRITKAE